LNVAFEKEFSIDLGALLTSPSFSLCRDASRAPALISLLRAQALSLIIVIVVAGAAVVVVVAAIHAA
jgi:hypothetical protein